MAAAAVEAAVAVVDAARNDGPRRYAAGGGDQRRAAGWRRAATPRSLNICAEEKPRAIANKVRGDKLRMVRFRVNFFLRLSLYCT